MTHLPHQGLSRALGRARAGDEQATDQLLRLCRSYVHVQAQRHLHGQLRPRLDASDIVQQSLLDAWQNFDGFRGETTSELVAWLKRIVQRNAVDAAREHQGAEKRALDREQPLAGPDDTARPTPEPVDQTLTPSQRLIRAEQELLLADAIAQLPADYQQVLICRSLERMPFAEVAARMSRSGPAVQMLWARAVKELRGVLDQGGATRVESGQTPPA